MTTCTCMVQEGRIDAAAEQALRTRLGEFSERAFGTPATIHWITVATGNGYTAGKPTGASVVSMPAAEPLPQARRVELLTELCELWQSITHCSDDELVAVIADPRAA